MKRLAASFEVMGRDRGFSRADRRAVVVAGVREYRARMRTAAGMPTLGAWYDHLEAGEERRVAAADRGDRGPSAAGFLGEEVPGVGRAELDIITTVCRYRLTERVSTAPTWRNGSASSG